MNLDVQEVVGSGVALNLLSGMPVWVGCLALAIYISVYIAMKYSKLSAKYALRFLLITFLLIIITYFLNILIIDRYT